MKKIVVVGATSAIAHACMKLWISEPVECVMIGRDAPRLDLVVADLKVRSPASSFRVEVVDFLDAAAIEQLAAKVDASLGGADLFLVAHGFLPDQGECQRDLESAKRSLLVNAVSPALFAEAFAARVSARGKGAIAVIGSVAGDRGRQSNYNYGAAKALLDAYCEGLSHRFAGSGVKVSIIKPGPTDTPMTANIGMAPSKLADIGAVARTIVKGIDAGKPVVYAPRKWALIMFVIRSLPRLIFNKLRI